MKYLLDTNACIRYLNGRSEPLRIRIDGRGDEQIVEAAGTPIGAYDLLISTIALSRQLVVVTANTDEFQRVPGLLVENWEVASTT